MKDLQDWAAVQKLYKSTKNISYIAETLDMSRTTVYSLLTKSEEPVYQRSLYPCKVEPYKDKIIEWKYSSEYQFNGTRIFRELKKLGYTGSIHPLYSFLKKISQADFTGNTVATVRVETPIGDQAQFDWSPYQVIVGTRIREVYCFSMILAASRKKAVVFSLSSDADAIYEAIQELFDELGGVTIELLIDNPKALVIENNPQTIDEIEYNPRALLVAKHLGTELNACNCYWPRTKGKVESPFKYIEEQFIKGNKFESMEHLNREGKKFVNEWCDEIHSTTKRVPNEFYENEERKVLLPLPASHLYFDDKKQKRKISNDSFIHIDTNKYSLPTKYAGIQVTYRILYGFRIQIYLLNGTHIYTLEATDGKHTEVKDERHYDEIRTVSKSIPQIKRDFTSTFRNGSKYLEVAGKHLQQVSHHAREILKLLDMFEADDLDKILAYAIEHHIYSAKEIRCLIKEKGFEILHPQAESEELKCAKESAPDGLTRSLDYYENNVKEEP